jgi:alkylated DNA repair dioxygenase AlkB
MQHSLFDMTLSHQGHAPTVAADSLRYILPKDGQADYHRAVFDLNQCSALFEVLQTSLDWQHDRIIMFGKEVITKRKVVWVANEGCTYKYAGVMKAPSPWTPELMVIKNEVERLTKWSFNSCLLNLYHDGNEGMGWHSDDETELDPNAPIASVSFGGERTFAFKHKADNTRARLALENGSVLIMHPPTQACWLHSLTKTKRPVQARINLTFRSVQRP